MLKNKKNMSKKIFLLLFFLFFTQSIAATTKSVIIGFHNQPGKNEKNLIKQYNGIIKHTFTLLPAVAAEIPRQNIISLRKHPSVTYIEEDKTVSNINRQTLSTKSRNYNSNRVSHYIAQDVNSSNEYKNNWGIEYIKAKIAHDKNITAKNIKIAILDTGIDYTHIDLKDNYKGGYNFIKNDRNESDPFDDGWNMHGTHIAGIIAARANDTGIVGVAPDASIYAVKVLDAGGFGSVSDIISGIEWAVNNKMDIANISISGEDSNMLKSACDAAEKAGLLIVAAAGNTYANSSLYPASYDSVIAVSSIDNNGSLSFFSPVDNAVEIVAPGLHILSTTGNNDYAILSGTSQSAAFISGVAALIKSSGVGDLNEDGEINNLDVRKKLQLSVKDLGKKGRDNKFGYGLILANKAVKNSNHCNDNHQYTYDEGWNSGYDPGFEEGKNDALLDKQYQIDSHFDEDGEFDEGWKDGYYFGYEEGWNSIKNPQGTTFYMYTYDEGWDSGFDPGYEEGKYDSCSGREYKIDSHFDDDNEFDDGWKDGYTYGYEKGWQCCTVNNK